MKVFITKRAGDFVFNGKQCLDPTDPVIVPDDQNGEAGANHGAETAKAEDAEVEDEADN